MLNQESPLTFELRGLRIFQSACISAWMFYERFARHFLFHPLRRCEYFGRLIVFRQIAAKPLGKPCCTLPCCCWICLFSWSFQRIYNVLSYPPSPTFLSLKVCGDCGSWTPWLAVEEWSSRNLGCRQWGMDAIWRSCGGRIRFWMTSLRETVRDMRSRFTFNDWLDWLVWLDWSMSASHEGEFSRWNHRHWWQSAEPPGHLPSRLHQEHSEDVDVAGSTWPCLNAVPIT